MRLWLFVFFLGSAIVSAQQPNINRSTGHPLSYYSQSGIDSVDLSSGNLKIQIPLFEMAGRGLDSTYVLTYNSKLWTGQDFGSCIPEQGCTHDVRVFLDPDGGGGWNLGNPRMALVGPFPYQNFHPTLPPPNVAWTESRTVYMGDGTRIRVVNDDGWRNSNSQPPVPTSFWSTDGSYIRVRNGVIYFKDGSRIEGGTLRDTNGNVLFSCVAGVCGDTVGRTFTSHEGPNGSTELRYTDSNGATQSVTFNNSIIGNGKLSMDGFEVGAPPLTTSVELPDGTTYSFEYVMNPDGSTTGEISKLTLPGGGYIRYTYEGSVLAGVWSGTGENRNVKKRFVSPSGSGADEQEWQYSIPFDSPCLFGKTSEVIDPLGNREKHIEGPAGRTIQYRNAAGTLLKEVIETVGYDWTSHNDMPEVSICPPNPRILERKTILYDNGASRTSKVAFTYSAFGNVASQTEFDWGLTQVLRTTTTSYLHQHDSNYANLDVHLLDRVRETVVSDGNNAFRTLLEYDTTGHLLNVSASIPGRVYNGGVDSFGTNHTKRGNVTLRKRFFAEENRWLEEEFRYDILGNLRSYKDAQDHETTYTYNDQWSQSTCAPAGQSFAFLTEIKNHLQHRTQHKWHSCTGRLGSTADENDILAGRSTQFSFDKNNRLTDVIHHDGGGSKYSYPDALTVSAETRLFEDTGGIAKLRTTTKFDGVGRPIRGEAVAPDCTIKTDSTYDALNRIVRVTNPYCTSSDGHTDTIYDGIGRIRKVIPQDGTEQSNNVATEHNFECSTTTDQAGKQRRQCLDAVGRLVRVDEPARTIVPASNATFATGSVSISGSVRSTSVMTSPATPGTGSVSIFGGTYCQTIYIWNGYDYVPEEYCDNGYVRFIVGSFTKDIYYDHWWGPNNGAAIAAAAVAAFNSDPASPVTAAQSNSNWVVFTAKVSGANTNYSLQAYDATNYPSLGFDSFNVSRSGPTLTGGANAVFSTVYDTGVLRVTVNGTMKETTYANGSTAASIASNLAAQFEASGPAGAVAVGGNINFTSRTAGEAGNFGFSTFSNTTSPHFSGTSFPVNPVSGSLSGGFEAVPEHETGEPSLATPATTLYTYDAIDNLRTVVQSGSRQRTFTYDSLSRLKSADNPESGLIEYKYDDDGNVVEKKSPKPNVLPPSTDVQTITYCYDELHRLTKKFFSAASCTGAANVTYTFDQGQDAKGRRTGMTDSSGSASWTYNAMGRIASEQRTINAVTKRFDYTYNLDGSVKTIEYPSDRTIKYAYNVLGQPVSAVDEANSINYVTAAKYSPFGSLCSVNFGANIKSTFTFNKRSQPIRIHATTVGAPDGCLAPTQTGSILDLEYDFNLNVANNGNVLTITNHRNTSRSQNFTYDHLNRLATAQTTSNLWGNSYVYDRWGNLLQKNPVEGKLEGELLNKTANVKNHLSGELYDIAGNQLRDVFNQTLTYDAVNRITCVGVCPGTGGVAYTYDGDGKRVKKSDGKLYWTGMGSDAFVETDATGNNPTEYVFFNGKRVARREADSAVHYYLSDHLGSSSIVTNDLGSITPCPPPSGPSSGEDESDYYPFGGERVICDRLANQNYKFTGKERDTETNLAYFGARYYASSLGRFMTHDPGNAAAYPINPQSWNAYSYVHNRPLALVDPNGLEPVKAQAGTIHGFAQDMNSTRNKVGQTRGADAARALQRLGETELDFQKGVIPSNTVFNLSANRYVYTANGGWVDMVHFVFYAGRAATYKAEGDPNPVGNAVQDGFQQERLDTVFAPWSAYSYDDLPSNRLGAIFGAQFFDPTSSLTLAQQIELFVQLYLHPMPATSAPNYANIPANDTRNPPTATNRTTNPMYTYWHWMAWNRPIRGCVTAGGETTCD